MGANGLAGLVSGFQQGYSYVDDLQRKRKDDDRKAAEEDRTKLEFDQKKKTWDRESADEDDDKKLYEKYFGVKPKPVPLEAAGVAPVVNAPSAIPAPAAPLVGGAPDQIQAPSNAQQPIVVAQPIAPLSQPVKQARLQGADVKPAEFDPTSDMSNFQAYARESMQLKIRRGKATAKDYQDLVDMQQTYKDNNFDKAMHMVLQGRPADSVKMINQSGDLNIKEVLSVQDGVYEGSPTKIITYLGSDDKPHSFNALQTLVEGQKIGQMIAQRNEAAKTAEMGRRNKADEAIGAKNAESHRISAESSASSARMQKLLLDQESRVPKATQMAVAAILKEQDHIAAATAKAQADGSYNADGPGAKTLAERSAILNMKAQKLLEPYMGDTSANSDPAKFRKDDTPRKNLTVNPNASGLDLSKLTQKQQDYLKKTDPDAYASGVKDFASSNTAVSTPQADGVPNRTPNAERVKEQAKRVKEIAMMNGIYNPNSRRNAIVNGRIADISANFDTNLKALQSASNREAKFKLSTWFDENSEYLSAAQSKQLRDTRAKLAS